jgi:mannitol-1-phosphate 5-dehydrogenase
VMACENAINASDILHSFVTDKKTIAKRAIFLNTAVDRIIPIQRSESQVDVWVESFSEWVIDVSRLGSTLPIPGTVQVDNLDPYIERKLFTVNTSHLAAAYFGQRTGHETIVSALSDSEVFEATRRALDETSAVIRARHGVSAEDQQSYVTKTLERISNPAIDDYVVRVGREPLRKLSRNERLIGPAAYFAEHIGEPAALLAVVDAALSFRSAEDKQVVELQQLLTQHEPIELAQTVCGIEQEHPLAPSLIRLFDLHKSAVSRKS